jgi:NADP-dependent 3-hydroxy acid dehydrogenase YdfG
VRNTAAGRRTAEDIKATTGSESVTLASLDLTDPASVQAFVTAWDGPLHSSSTTRA